MRPSMAVLRLLSRGVKLATIPLLPNIPCRTHNTVSVHCGSVCTGCSTSSDAQAVSCSTHSALLAPGKGANFAVCCTTGYANQFHSVPSIQSTQCCVSPMLYAGSAADSSRGNLGGIASCLCDTQTSETEVRLAFFMLPGLCCLQCSAAADFVIAKTLNLLQPEWCCCSFAPIASSNLTYLICM